MLEDCCPRAATVLEDAEPDALAYLDFPQSHWKRLRTNNVQERTNRETRRRSKVVQVFPSARSLERLAGAVMCDQDDGWQESRYFPGRKMSEPYDESLGAHESRRADADRDAELLLVAKKAIDASLELADELEAA